MPKLHDHFAAFGMHRRSDRLPSLDLFCRPNAWHIGVSLALVADGGCLGDDEACARCGVGALGIVFRHERIRQSPWRTVASQRGHHNA